MDDMAGKISELLSDPEGMEKIKAMASTLFSDTNSSNQPQNVPNSNDKESGLSLPEGFDPMKLMGIFSALKTKVFDDRAALLMALKPYLSNDRQEKVEKAVRLLKIASLLPILKEQGILDDLL